MRGTHLWSWLFKGRFFGSRIARRHKLIALSFDDGASRHTHDILKILNDHGVSATFFWIAEVTQKFSENYPILFDEILTMIKEGGHEIGLHGLYNRELSPSERVFGQQSKEELLQGKQILEDLVKSNIMLYRPHGVQAGSSVDDVLTTVGGLPLTTMHGIPGMPGYTFPTVQPGSILILHDGESDERKSVSVIEILPLVLEKITRRGLRQSLVSIVLKAESIAA